MFGGKESSNRIEISRLVQELLKFWCFGLPAALGRGQVGGGVSGGIWGHGGCHHTHTHTHACTHRHAHTCIEIANGHRAWRHPCLSCLSCLTCMCVRACMRVHAWETPHTLILTPTPIHPSATPPGGDPHNQLKFNRHLN